MVRNIDSRNAKGRNADDIAKVKNRMEEDKSRGKPPTEQDRIKAADLETSRRDLNGT